MKAYAFRSALLLVVTALVAVGAAVTASARMAPPELTAPAPSTPGVRTVAPGLKIVLGVPAKKKHHGKGKGKGKGSTQGGTGTTYSWGGIPPGCTLGYSDGYVWGYSC